MNRSTEKRNRLESQPVPPVIGASGSFHFTVTITAVNGFTVTRFEGNLGSFAAIGTNSSIHLTRSITIVARSVGGAVGSIRLARCPACGTTFWIVHETLGLIKFLFGDGELKVRPAIATRNRFGLKIHG